MKRDYKIVVKDLPSDIAERISRLHAAGLLSMAKKQSVGQPMVLDGGNLVAAVDDNPKTKELKEQ